MIETDGTREEIQAINEEFVDWIMEFIFDTTS
jgi:hypothetical protein